MNMFNLLLYSLAIATSLATKISPHSKRVFINSAKTAICHAEPFTLFEGKLRDSVAPASLNYAAKPRF